jgi:hypothetical protein
MVNLEPYEIEEWKKEIYDAKQWLTSLQAAISEREFAKLHGNILRIKILIAN